MMLCHLRCDGLLVGMCGVLFCHVTFVKKHFLPFGTLFALVLMRAFRIDGGRLVRH